VQHVKIQWLLQDRMRYLHWTVSGDEVSAGDEEALKADGNGLQQQLRRVCRPSFDCRPTIILTNEGEIHPAWLYR
jgi:hypothetical protein